VDVSFFADFVTDALSVTVTYGNIDSSEKPKDEENDKNNYNT
jgi:hypothetical protein